MYSIILDDRILIFFVKWLILIQNFTYPPIFIHKKKIIKNNAVKIILISIKLYGNELVKWGFFSYIIYIISIKRLKIILFIYLDKMKHKKRGKTPLSPTLWGHTPFQVGLFSLSLG